MFRALIAMPWVGIILLAVAGCKHQPDLKPPPQPEVLASPGPNDNRYVQPANYPADTLANDPFKAGLNNGVTPANAKRGGGGPGGAGGSMGPGNMGGPGG